MAVVRHEVFIASSFSEFNALREALHALIESFQVFPIEVINLNRNQPHGVPPLQASLTSASRSDVVVLLVGEEYGGIPAGETLSYAHLEYQSALNSDPTILAFFANRNDEGESRLQAWKSEIRANQTVAILDQDETVEDQAEFIFVHVQSALWEKMTTTEQLQVHRQDIEEGDESEDETEAEDDARPMVDQLPAEELLAIEHHDAGRDSQFSSRDVSSWKTNKLLRFPAAVSATEQIREASAAMKIGEWRVAIQHFRRALEIRPMDMENSYRMARLLTSTRRKKDAAEALAFAERSATMAKHDARDVWQAAAQVVAAQAATQSGDEPGGLRRAKKATEIAPWFAATHIELARQHVTNGDWNAGMTSARTAFRLRPLSLEKLNREPAFRTNPEGFREFKRSLRKESLEAVTALFNCERQQLELVLRNCSTDESVSKLNSVKTHEHLERMSTIGMLRAGCATARRQLGLLSQLAARLDPPNLGDLEAFQAVMADFLKPMIDAWRSRPMPKTTTNVVVGALAVSCSMIFLGILISQWLVWAGVLLLVGSCCYAYTEFLGDGRANPDASAEQRNASPDPAQQRSVDEFRSAILDFEAASLDWHVLSPGRNADAAKVGDLVRIDMSALSRYPDVELTRDLLPKVLRNGMPTENEAGNRYELFRVTRIVEGRKYAARWACYFDPKRYADGEVRVASATTSSWW